MHLASITLSLSTTFVEFKLHTSCLCVRSDQVILDYMIHVYELFAYDNYKTRNIYLQKCENAKKILLENI